MAKLVARLRATAALLGSNPDISHKYKWATYVKDGPTHSRPPKSIKKFTFLWKKKMFMPQSLAVVLGRISFGAYPGPAFSDNKHLNPVRSLTIK
jgi:hypothetical protein